MMAAGTWFIRSDKDPRWNASGHSPSVGGFVMPEETQEELERMKKLYNGEPPEDCEIGYMKD